MEWLGNNWFWLVIIGGMFGIHFFGHRRHGSGRHHGAPPSDHDIGATPGKVSSEPHSHGAMADGTETAPQATRPPDQKTATKHKLGC
ncbi:MAG: hypothetical protein ABI832_20860 [bacterium]